MYLRQAGNSYNGGQGDKVKKLVHAVHGSPSQHQNIIKYLMLDTSVKETQSCTTNTAN